MDRNTALGIVSEHVRDLGLRRHMLAVEAGLRGYAAKLGGDPEIWGLAGLLHDFDWEIHPDLQRHPAQGAPILRARGCPEEAVRAILSHSEDVTGVKREAPLDFALLACDEITGLITAVALVRPSKNIADVKVKSVKNKWKDRSFAAGVDRGLSEQAVSDFSRECFGGGLDLWAHVENVLVSMQGIAAGLGLAGS